jgi:hypothetical protein
LRLRAALPRSAGHVPARVELADAAVARADDGRWVRRVTFWLAHDSGRELRAVWAAPVRVLAVALDGRSLVTSADPTGCVLVPLPDAVGARALEVIWAPTDDDGLPPSGPDVPKLTLDGEAVPAGPLLWTAHALSGSPPPAAAGDSPAGAPLSPATAALYRAAAQVRLAGLLHDPQAVGSSPAMSEQATALRARAGFYLRQADVTRAGEPDADGANLTAWRQQLHDALGAAAGLRAPEPSGVLHPFEDAFTRGVPITWSIAPGANGPRLTWPAPAPTWPANLRRTALLALLGVFGVWWWRRVGAAGWPEQLIVVGLVGGTAGAGSVWLVPAATGVGARLFLLGRAALRRWWWTEDAGGSPTPNGPLPA